ncbi:MAG: hypothetical protein HGA80_02260 [Candidatus Omnitrophica bacterium]|nr:hypothetical protein [Candidatus Omnitrophota bacterium]
MRLFCRGITLSELLIATLIVSIMVVGIGSTNFAVHRMDKDSHRSAALSIQMLSLAENFRKAAESATGDRNDPGVLINNTGTVANYICFRQDVQPPGVPTPADYSDDTWQCFTRLNDSGAALGVNVWACQRAAAAGAGACTTAGRFVGKLVSNVFTNNPPITVPSFDLATGIINLQLIGRADPAVGADTANWPNGTDDNPQIVIEQDIYSESHSL